MDSPQAKVVFAKGAFRVEVEGTEDFVRDRLEQLLPLMGAGSDESVEDVDLPDEESSDESPDSKVSLKAFLASKKPQNASEAIACVVFFNKKFRNRDELSTDEIRQALITGRQRPPGNMTQAMTDCRRRYGYIEPGTKKGLWKVSHDGEVTVEMDLPRG